MATPLSFDEVNKLNRVVRSMPFERYFGEMEISPEQKQKRTRLAEAFESEFLFVLAWVFYRSQSGMIASSDILPRFREAYDNALHDSGEDINREKVADYVDMVTAEMANSTAAHIQDSYFVSEDRAKYMAENESNTLWNKQEFSDAEDKGLRYKKWLSILDERTRPTHAIADGQEQPIELPFDVGGFFMMFPKDDSMGAPASEIVGCRCSVAYF